MDQRQKIKLIDSIVVQKYHNGDIIIDEGDKIDYLYIIEQGIVMKKYDGSPIRKEASPKFAF